MLSLKCRSLYGPKVGEGMAKQAGLHRRIREARLASGLTQPKLAKLVGVTRAAVSQWEALPGAAGSARPTYEKLQAIAAVTGQSLSILLGEASADKLTTEQRMVARLWVQIPKTARKELLALLKRLSKS